MRRSNELVLGLVVVFIMVSSALGKEGEMVVESGKQVAFNYTLRVDGEIVDSSLGREPLVYTHGSKQIIPGLAKQLEGMRVGEKKEVTVPPVEAYGVVRPDARQAIPRTSLPKDVEPKVGMVLQLQKPNGNVGSFRITEVTNDAVVVDLNHPLAGKTLIFDVAIVSIK